MAEIKKTVYKQVLVRMWRNWDSYIATRTVKWWSYFGKWYFKKKLTLSNHMGTFTPRHILKRNENICPHICCVFSRLVMSNSLRPMDCRPPGSSLHGIFQARILEWVAVSFSKGFPTQGSNLHLLHWQADSFTTEPLGEPRPCICVYTNFTAEWFIIAKQVKQPQCLSTCEWINYMSYTLTIEYYLAREKLLTHAIRWMNFESRLNKRSQSQKTIIVRFLLYEMSLVGCSPWSR